MNLWETDLILFFYEFGSNIETILSTSRGTKYIMLNNFDINN